MSTADLSMFIYALGILDMGKPETWVLLEQLVFDNFLRFKKIDFDNSIAGFGYTKNGSMKLM